MIPLCGHVTVSDLERGKRTIAYLIDRGRLERITVEDTAAVDSISRTVRVMVALRSSAEGRTWRTLAGSRAQAPATYGERACASE